MNPQDYQHLIQQLIDGEISAGDFARLDGELRQNPEALAAYRLYAGIHSGLVRKGEIDAAIRTSPVVPINRVMALQRRQVARNSLLAAAAVIVISGLVLWQTMAPKKSAVQATLSSTPGSSFTLSHTAEGPDTSPWVLSQGSTIRLDHGAVELSLPHQVRAILEAPATLTLIDEHTVDLARGRGYFEVKSPDGHGFTVETPHQKIVDLGTAFSIDLPVGSDETHLHVFEGSVRIDGLDGKETGETIRAPMAVSIRGSKVSGELEGSNELFRRQLPDRVERVFTGDFEWGLLAGKDYAIHMDPTVLSDLAGNRFAGITEKEPWRFSTSKELRIRNPGFETDSPGDKAPLHWREVTGEGVLFNTYTESPKATEGSKRLLVPPDKMVVQDLGATIRAGTTYQLILDAGNCPARFPSQAVVRFYGSDAGHEAPLAEIRLDPAKNAWLRGRTLSFSATPKEATGQTLGIALSSKDGFSSFDDLRIVETRGVDQAEPAASISEESGPNGQPDTRPPLVSSFHPAPDASNAGLDDTPTLVFDEPVRFGTGRITIRNLTDSSEADLVVGSNRTLLRDRVLTFLPPLRLAEGASQVGGIPGWESSGPVSRFNPSGNGDRYRHPDLADNSKTRGALGSMKGPTLTTLGNAEHPGTIRRSLGKAEEDRTYTVSVGIGCRDATDTTPFAGYRIRLLRGSAVLAEVSGETPPGSPNSITPAGFSWDSSDHRQESTEDAPLILEISTLLPMAGKGGELDIDHVQVTSLGKSPQ